MKTASMRQQLSAMFVMAVVIVLYPGATRAGTTVFFDSSQTTNLVTSGTTSYSVAVERRALRFLARIGHFFAFP
jgi:hypothetical protein